MNRNDRVITDLTTGMELPQHKMLKVLFDRSRLKRNDWHEKAQQLVGRSLGSPTKLSDIFNGKLRSLPMRDIVPYIQALGMRKSETDYYIAEFFKAYCDENLHQYVQSRSKSQQILMLEQKLKVKEFEIKRLNRQMTYTIMYQKYVLRNEKSSTSIPNASNAHIDSDLIFSIDAACTNYLNFNAEELSTHEIDNMLNIAADMSFQKSMEFSEREKDEEYYYNRLNECQYKILEEELLSSYRQWYLVLILILGKKDDMAFKNVISLMIPNSFDTQIIEHEEGSLLHPMPSFRTIYEITSSNISKLKTENKEAFEQLLAIQKKYYLYFKNFKRPTGRDEEIKRLKEVDQASLLEESYSITDFENAIHSGVCSKFDFPFDIDFMTFDRPEIRRTIKEFFHDFFSFNELGLSFSISFDELCSLQNPPVSTDAFSDQMKLKQLLSVIEKKSEEICQDFGFDNPIKQIIEHPDYPNFFEGKQRRRAATPSWMDRLSNRNKTS